MYSIQLPAVEENRRDNEEKKTLHEKNVRQILKWPEEHFQEIFREVKVKSTVHWHWCHSDGCSLLVDMTKLTSWCTARIWRSAPAPGQPISSVSTMCRQVLGLQSTVSTGRSALRSTARREKSSSTPTVCLSSWSGTPSRDSSQRIW